MGSVSKLGQIEISFKPISCQEVILLPQTSYALWIMADIQVYLSRLVAHNQLDKEIARTHSIQTPYGTIHRE